MTAPSVEQFEEWRRVVRDMGYTHKRIRHDEQTAAMRFAWAPDDWHCICGAWGGPFGDHAYAIHLEEVIRDSNREVPVR